MEGEVQRKFSAQSNDAAKAELKRDGTMLVTAKEGVRFLVEAGKHTLLEMQGLNPPPQAAVTTTTVGDVSSSQPSANKAARMARAGTMPATAKEGESFLRSEGFVEGKRRGDTANSASKKLKLSEPPQHEEKPATTKRTTTMQQTAKEGKELLRGMGHSLDDTPDEGRRTRSQKLGGEQGGGGVQPKLLKAPLASVVGTPMAEEASNAGAKNDDGSPKTAQGTSDDDVKESVADVTNNDAEQKCQTSVKPPAQNVGNPELSETSSEDSDSSNSNN